MPNLTPPLTAAAAPPLPPRRAACALLTALPPTLFAPAVPGSPGWVELRHESICLAANNTSCAFFIYSVILRLLEKPAACEALGASAVFRLVAASAAPLQPAASETICAIVQRGIEHTLRVLWDAAFAALTVLRDLLEVAAAGVGRRYGTALKSTLCRPEILMEQLDGTIAVWSAAQVETEGMAGAA